MQCLSFCAITCTEGVLELNGINTVHDYKSDTNGYGTKFIEYVKRAKYFKASLNAFYPILNT